MRATFGLLVLFLATVVAQVVLFPAFVPPALRPDVGIVVAMAALAFAPREFGLVCVFALGLQADLFGSTRFGLLTLSYLLAAGFILWMAWRELTRGDLLAAWVGGIAGTAVAHFLYLCLARLSGMSICWGAALTTILWLSLAACVWGLLCAWACGRFMYRTGLLTPPVRERWLADERLAAARRRKVARA